MKEEWFVSFWLYSKKKGDKKFRLRFDRKPQDEFEAVSIASDILKEPGTASVKVEKIIQIRKHKTIYRRQKKKG